MTKEPSSQLNALCVFCGSSLGVEPAYRQSAERLGRHLADAGITLVFGGGHVGLMGVLANAALKAGGRVIGIIPDHLLKVEAPFREISELIVVDSMHTRKRRMFDLADAFCVLPGGLGTLDETFEILTWKQLHLHNKPIILANIEGYWAPWMALFEATVDKGFVQSGAQRLFSLVDSIDDVLPTAQREINAVRSGEPKLF
jgi:uncharacterized protein (TIGR00730 family)